MSEVGIRELKSRLSEYLSRVKQGEQVVITERGVPIAIIVPSGQVRNRETMMRLVREGVVLWRGGKPALPAELVPVTGKPLSQVVLEGRE